MDTIRSERKPRIGLLPLYLELYDRVMPEARARAEEFYARIVSELEKRGIEVVRSSVCRLRPEVETAVDEFMESGVDLLVTLHLAYSPSLESVDVLARSRLGLVVLDTTPAFGYGPQQDPAELMYNHGIHGVQDLCNMLYRRGKRFQIEVGHWERSDVLDRLAAWARSALLATAMRKARVGLIGRAFDGMGDFLVSPDILRSAIGIETITTDFTALSSLLPGEHADEVLREMERNRAEFNIRNVDDHVHRGTVRACLAVRRWMEAEEATAFTFNFALLHRSSGFPTAPFLEASRAMMRGKGYAGEGDVLTAALVGALLSVYPETTFTEMFCPDWEGNTILLSHMGEMNLRLADGQPLLLRKDMPWINADAPAVAVGRLKGGEALLINLAPIAEEDFRLIIAPVQIAEIENTDTLIESVRGWLRPHIPVADFLKAFSEAAGTHHCALAYGADVENLVRFGQLMGWDVVVLR